MESVTKDINDMTIEKIKSIFNGFQIDMLHILNIVKDFYSESFLEFAGMVRQIKDNEKIWNILKKNIELIVGLKKLRNQELY